MVTQEDRDRDVANRRNPANLPSWPSQRSMAGGQEYYWARAVSARERRRLRRRKDEDDTSRNLPLWQILPLLVLRPDYAEFD